METLPIQPQQYRLNIEVLTSSLGKEQQHTLEILLPFLDETTNTFQEDFWEAIEYRNNINPGLVSERIIQFLIEHNFDLPRFQVWDNQQGKEFIKKIYDDLDISNQLRDEEIADDTLILAFNLPKPLAQFWSKIDFKFNPDYIDISNNNIIPWGSYYLKTINLIRRAVDDEEQGLRFRRIANIPHIPSRVYYIWEVSNNEYSSYFNSTKFNLADLQRHFQKNLGNKEVTFTENKQKKAKKLSEAKQIEAILKTLKQYSERV